jgi:hypothetical protein
VEELDELFKRLPGQGVQSVRRNNSVAKAGRNIDLRTPFYSSKTRKDICEEVKRACGITHIAAIDELDSSEEKKIGAISFVPPANERLDSLLAYWEQTFAPDRDALQWAFTQVVSLIRPHSVRSLDMESAFKRMAQTAQSLGLPWNGRDKKWIPWYQEHWLTVKSPEDMFPCMWYARSQSNGTDTSSKVRNVWGYPHDAIGAGQQYMGPTLDALRSLPMGFSAWRGNDYVDVACSRILRETKGMVKVSMDFKGYDSSLAPDLLQMGDALLERWNEVRMTETIRLLGAIELTIGIVTPFGIYKGRYGGMPSGSVTTNLKDSLINLLAGFYLAYRNGTALLYYEVMGDDSVYVFRDELSAETIANTVSELGLTSNPEKIYMSRDSLHFLQRIHCEAYVVGGLNVGVRSIMRSISGDTGIERVTDNNHFMWTARQITRMEECRNHPNFKAYVKYWYDADDIWKTGIDPVLVIQKAGGSLRVRETVGSASFPYSSVSPEGVNDWAVTRLIRSF